MNKMEIGGKIKNKAINEYINKNIIRGEFVIATMVGLGGDHLLVTNKKIVIMKKGLATWATGGFGLKTKSHFLDKINSIDIGKGLISCDLEIVSGGMVEKSSGSFLASAGSENIIQFEKALYDEATILVNQIREMIDGINSPSPPPIPRKPPPVHQGEDIPNQIYKLSKLFEQGILTEEEFQNKKTELLDRL